MNILFVNNGYSLFAKADSGASQRSMRVIRALAHMGHVDVVTFTDAVNSTIDDVDVIYANRMDWTIVPNGIITKIRSLIHTSNPNLCYPIHPGKEKVLDGIISKQNYDLIVIRYIHFASECGLLKYANRLVIDIDDDPKQVIQMSFPREEGFLKRLYHRLYANAIDRVSRGVVDSVKCAFYSTPEMSYPNAHFLPNISVFQQPLSPPDFDNLFPTIMMVGWFTYYPNVEGLRHFITAIFPEIRKSVPNVTLHVVGKMNDENLWVLCANTEGVEALGFVEDLEEQYKRCHCVVVPIYSGTGTSIKLVEAMSLRRAVVATPCGARGLNPAFIPNKDFFMAESDNDFSQKVIRLLNHSDDNCSMADNAYRKIEQYYSEEKFNQIIQSSL
jgi:glycosyltransferase involved in cell wall biosynthesis